MGHPLIRRVLPSMLLVSFLLFPAVSGLARESVPVPSAGDKCPVCGMFVAKFPKWAAAVRLRDGALLHFDGAKDFFTWYLSPGSYTPGRKPTDVAAVWVRDYYTLGPVDGRKAVYVVGSDVAGPMGHELIPFAAPADAGEFMKDHHGSRILTFREVTPQVLKGLK